MHLTSAVDRFASQWAWSGLSGFPLHARDITGWLLAARSYRVRLCLQPANIKGVLMKRFGAGASCVPGIFLIAGCNDYANTFQRKYWR